MLLTYAEGSSSPSEGFAPVIKSGGSVFYRLVVIMEVKYRVVDEAWNLKSAR